MVIKASASREITTLIDALLHGEERGREAALARLAVIGPRTVERLITAYDAAPSRQTRIAILRALEANADRRSLQVALRALNDGSDVAIAAAGVLRVLQHSSDADTAVKALDALIGRALDRSTERRVRIALLESLGDMPQDLRSRLDRAVGETAPFDLRESVSSRREAPLLNAIWSDALDGRIPDEARALREAVALRAQTAPLNSLQKLVDRLRARERSAAAGAEKTEWLAARAALHQMLALRGSRVALYDLRETVEQQAGAVPAAFLPALQLIGDDSCLDALANAYSHIASSDIAGRHRIAATFRTIVRREKLTRRHAVLRRIAARWPEAVGDLMGAA